MVTKERALGDLFNVAVALAPKDLSSGASTGLRIDMRNATTCTFVVLCGAGTAGDDLVVDLQEHNAASGGTSQDLDIITEYFRNSETTLDGDEVWTRYTQAAASETTDTTGTTAEEQNLMIIEVRHDQLSDGFKWLSLNIPDLGSAGTKYGGAIAILSGLRFRGKPERLPTALGS
jgi:hypothetical protein